MNWTTAWEIAGEICDLIGNTTIQQQEKIATIIQNRSKQTFNAHNQKWQDNIELQDLAAIYKEITS